MNSTNKVSITQRLIQSGIGFNKEGQLHELPIDNENPILDASQYYLNKETLSRITRAWDQWKKFVKVVLQTNEGRDLVSRFFIKGNQDSWNDFERSEFGLYQNKDYFFGPHVTRIDFALDEGNELVILDPNVMPYGIVPMIATQEMLGIKYHEDYLEKLRLLSGTWVVDRYHGNSSSIEWLSKRVNNGFEYSDEFQQSQNVIRLSRKVVHGLNQTIGAPGIRIFESQFWSALMNINGIGEAFGFSIDKSLHRKNCAPCFLLKVHSDKVYVGASYKSGIMEWVGFDDFFSLRWGGLKTKAVFLKCLSTSGCHQVTWSDAKEQKVLKSIRNKLGNEGYFLLQPALPCLVNNERVRIASYVGPKGEHYGSEVTRVPESCMLSHSGFHAKESYLVF